MEETLEEGEHHTHHEAQAKGKNNLQDGLDHDGENVHLAADHGLRYAEGASEQHQTHCIVQCYDGKQYVGDGAFCLILAYDHQSCGGSGSGGYCTENDGCRQGQQVGNQEVQADEGGIHQNGGEDSLPDTDHGGLFADLLQLRKAEFVTDGKSNKAQGNVGDQGIGLDILHADKAETLHAKGAEKVGADEDTRYKVSGNRGKMHPFCKTGQHQPGKKGNGQTKQGLHKTPPKQYNEIQYDPF